MNEAPRITVTAIPSPKAKKSQYSKSQFSNIRNTQYDQFSSQIIEPRVSVLDKNRAKIEKISKEFVKDQRKKIERLQSLDLLKAAKKRKSTYH